MSSQESLNLHNGDRIKKIVTEKIESPAVLSESTLLKAFRIQLILDEITDYDAAEAKTIAKLLVELFSY